LAASERFAYVESLLRKGARMGRLAVGIVVVLVLAGTAVAAASIPDASGVIHGCRSTKTGVLRVIDTDAGQTCSKDEAALSWNQIGPQGPAGPQG